MRNMTVYIMTHREFEQPEISGYVPLQVGAALHEDLGYLRDDTGDHISQKNPYYSELTGLYWMWKNAPKADITGLVHYRRYFVNAQGGILHEGEIRSLLAEYQAVVSMGILLPESVGQQYGMHHKKKDMQLVEDAIEKLCPEYMDTFHTFLSANRMHFGNMILTSQELLNQYCQWLFPILFYVEEHMDMTGYDDYNKRVYGFLSERLLTVWLTYNRISYKECMVSLQAEKTDTIVAAEKLKGYMERGEMEEALNYYTAIQREHPDYFHAGTRIDRDFIECCIVTQIYGIEKSMGVQHKISTGRSLEEMVKTMMGLRNLLVACHDEEIDGLQKYIEEQEISTGMLAFMARQYIEEKRGRLLLYSQLAEAYARKGDVATAAVYAQLALQQE